MGDVRYMQYQVDKREIHEIEAMAAPDHYKLQVKDLKVFSVSSAQEIGGSFV